jgi:hypothetical protein
MQVVNGFDLISNTDGAVVFAGGYLIRYLTGISRPEGKGRARLQNRSKTPGCTLVGSGRDGNTGSVSLVGRTDSYREVDRTI